MFLTRVSGFGNTTNLNRKRHRRRSTSPVVGRRSRPSLEALETRQLLSNLPIQVTNCSDSGAGSLRQAILTANASSSPADIVFDIPASNANLYPLLNVPIPGFDPVTQTWTITLNSPLPPITNTVSTDGYTEANEGVGMPYRYPSEVISAMQAIVVGSPTGGTFTLTTAAPLPVGTTVPISYDATAATVQAALGAIVGINNITVSGEPATGVPFFVTFQGKYAGLSIPDLVPTNNLTGIATLGLSPDRHPGGSHRAHVHPVDPEHNRRPAGK